MKNRRKNALTVIMTGLLLCLSTVAQAFVVKKIEFQGLVRVHQSMLGDLPIKKGEDLSAKASNKLITYLYSLNMPYSLFRQVSLWNDHGTLIIRLKESATIASVSFSGNYDIKTDQINEVLKKALIQKGKVYSPFMINQIKQSFLQAYYSKGKYAVKITTIARPVKQNQVVLDIKISEGIPAKIESINFVGNHAFSDRTLRGALTLTTPRPWSTFTGSDQYSQQKMQQSINALNSYYMDRGYLHYNVNSYQVALSPFRRHTYLTFNTSEGGQYTFKGYTLLGKFALPKATLAQLVSIQKGDIFSRQTVIDSIKKISDALANDGYAYANVTPDVKVDEKTKQVSVTLYVNPGQRVYIRYINFLGNSVTNDKVFRQNMKLMEASLYDKKKVAISKTFIQRLPYVGNVEQSMTPVANKPDAVDLNYKVTEKSANSVMGSLGYSTTDKWFVGGGVTFGNVLGSGNTLQLNSQLGMHSKQINVSYTQPFFTDTGISQTTQAYWRTTNTEDLNFVSYLMDRFGASVNYGIPLSTFTNFNVGVGFDHTSLTLPKSNASMVVKKFTDRYGRAYNSVTLSLGWSKDSTDLYWFPTQGVRASILTSATVPFSTLNYYTLSTHASWYYPLWSKVVFNLSGGAFYGHGYGKTHAFPFYLNQYSGGWGSVRGFSDGSLGPVSQVACTDSSDSACTGNIKPNANETVGGNLSVNATAALVFPVPLMNSDSVRLTVFTDTGYVYNTQGLAGVYNGVDPKTGTDYKNPRLPNFKNLRWSAGAGVMFVMPGIGAMSFSLAQAINSQGQDHPAYFNFTIGQSF